jgi:hypothetical protein
VFLQRVAAYIQLVALDRRHEILGTETCADQAKYSAFERALI